MRFFGMEVFQSGGTYSSLPSVPRSEIVLFYKDTVVLGYSLLIDENDGVVYYTNGSGAGGHTGGASKPSGTWTQPNHSHGVTVDSGGGHSHTMGSHTHTTASYALQLNEMPQHRHSLSLSPQITQDEMYGGYYGTGPARGDYYAMYTDYQGSSVAHNHGATGAPSNNTSDAAAAHAHTASSAASATANTWRPAGLCFTRQQRL